MLLQNNLPYDKLLLLVSTYMVSFRYSTEKGKANLKHMKLIFCVKESYLSMA